MHTAPPPRPDWKLAEIDPSSAPAMRELFGIVFGNPMSEAEWHWKYGDRHGHGIGVWEQGRLIAHYGGIVRRLLDAGTPCLGIQGADAAVLPEKRGYLTRRGPYFLAASTFHATFIGSDKPYRYGFGFPSERHFRLAATLGIYAAADKIAEFAFPPLPKRHFLHGARVTDIRAILHDSRLQHALTSAWERMRCRLPAALIGVRDPAYLAHRYARHPRYRYALLSVTPYRIGPPALFAILRTLPNNEIEWLDFVGDVRGLPLLASAVQRHAHRCNSPRVFGWITQSQAAFFTACGAALQATDVIVPADKWTNDPDVSTQTGRWWLMSGDTDFH